MNKVLIAGASGYVGRHVSGYMNSLGYQVFHFAHRPVSECDDPAMTVSAQDEHLNAFFDVVINCARPHWSQYSPQEIAVQEQRLMKQLDMLAAPDAVRIHTSGVWLFGHASVQDLKHFICRPISVVEPDQATIQAALNRGWNIVYCPSLIYGGDNCQLRRILAGLPDQQMTVAVPSTGWHQYVHVADIGPFYATLASLKVQGTQHFIAESCGYSAFDFAELLKQTRKIRHIRQVDWDTFSLMQGEMALEVEQMHLDLPVSDLFRATHSIRRYLIGC
ncbi:NAD(P)-dependent oxidoreductase (plasmid) [Photobacterium sp. GJ3]|uniref:NAD-dependent epimerase/dehydratase family protein n=1 Tax=Photobacterium sp. GJ3 TaxID=2829502 RepID=UPI001B8D03B8|nr:NAD-dependent epimerase/dehydratase family protein [Photobacterium sp. GJ3]QUJ69221.1 NAD(P)-dependent oxidoreductase [Photobacterium sp. GJ3]